LEEHITVSVARRDFLSFSFASLAGVALTPTLRNSTGTRAGLAEVAAASERRLARFDGDPGAGNVIYGASMPWTISVPGFEQQVGGHLGVHRSYFSAGQSNDVIAKVQDDHAHYRHPFVSIKLPGTWASVARGDFDTWLRTLIQRLGAECRPVWFALHHEPENDVNDNGMRPSDWVAMQNRAIDIARSTAPNVTIVPILMQWTFDSRSGRRPRDWMVDYATVFGVDLYNAWSASGNQHWVSFADQMDLVLPWRAGKPILLAEYGCRTDTSQPGRAAGWMTDAFDYARQHDIVVMSYFNSWQNSPAGSWELDGERLTTFSNLLEKSRATRQNRPVRRIICPPRT
jgi:hypothetical protein